MSSTTNTHPQTQPPYPLDFNIDLDFERAPTKEEVTLMEESMRVWMQEIPAGNVSRTSTATALNYSFIQLRGPSELSPSIPPPNQDHIAKAPSTQHEDAHFPVEELSSSKNGYAQNVIKSANGGSGAVHGEYSSPSFSPAFGPPSPYSLGYTEDGYQLGLGDSGNNRTGGSISTIASPDKEKGESQIVTNSTYVDMAVQASDHSRTDSGVTSAAQLIQPSPMNPHGYIHGSAQPAVRYTGETLSSHSSTLPAFPDEGLAEYPHNVPMQTFTDQVRPRLGHPSHFVHTPSQHRAIVDAGYQNSIAFNLGKSNMTFNECISSSSHDQGCYIVSLS